MDATATLRVALRARPLQDDEEMSDITFTGNQVTLNKASVFSFDTVYSPLSTQKDIFDTSIKPLFDSFLKGEHGAIYTFGYKGSGKSYSLGTIPNAELEPTEEGIRDLLVHPGMILQDVQDVRQKRVYSTHDLLRLLSKKAIDGPDLVFTVTLRQQKTVSKFHFIDISQKCANLDLGCLDQLVQNSQHRLWLTCISCARRDLSLIQETLQYGHHLSQPLTPEASQSLRSQITQLQLQIAHLQSNQLVGEEIKMIREEMEQIKSYSIQVSRELVETQSARDTLLLQLAQERPTEAHPLIQQYAQQIQDLKLEVVETRSKLNALCIEDSPLALKKTKEESTTNQPSPPDSPTQYSHHPIHHRMTSSISSGRKKRPVVQRMRTSSSSLLKKRHSHQKVDDFIERLRKQYTEESTGETVLPMSHAETVEEKTQTESKTEMVETTFPGYHIDTVAQPMMSPTSLAHHPISPTSPTYLSNEQNVFSTGEDELEALAVPSWSDMPKALSVSGTSTKRKSISLDSMWDDTDSSITTSRVDLTISEGQAQQTKSKNLNEHKLKRQNKNLLKMLHQIQADLLVKRELVGQLERSEDQFTQLRTNYEERLSELRDHLVEIQRQRDDALEKAFINNTSATTTATTNTGRSQSRLGLRENREAQEVRSQFEVKLKRLVLENQELKKKQTESTRAIQSARHKAEQAIQRLKADNDSLKSDKKQLSRSLKNEVDKAREAALSYEREIQQLKRRLVVAIDSKTKAEETIEAQNQVLKKRTEETTATNLQLRQLTNALRKAANEGTFLNEAALDKIMEYAQTSKSNIRTTKPSRARASSFASDPSI
ncbi:hypothetical protein BD560DRAFT_432769 [Blakeslea trispora]|nr:hypothetical protein BD560DRAFT_432769 [Blakeslea trispora]